MEDPIRFDVWGIVRTGENAAAVQFLRSRNSELSRVKALQLVLKSHASGSAMLLASGLGWKSLETVVGEVAAFTGAVRIYQSGYAPEEEAQLSYCEKHHLWYGGCLGCPVCDRREAP